MKMTITEALTKLKLTSKKIEKASKADFISYKIGGKVQKDVKPEENFQKAMDLINFRDKLKTAIMISNSKTSVKINGKEMLVIEAIEAKNSIVYRKVLLNELKKSLSECNYEVDLINQEAQRRLDNLLEASFGSDKRNTDTENVIKEFEKRNLAECYDPLNIEDLITKMEEEIDNFESEVDLVLSISNSTTFIKV